MAQTDQQILDILKEIIDKGFRPYVAKGTSDAINSAVQFLYENGGATIQPDHIFANDTDRDTYFQGNKEQLKPGLTILSANIPQIWVNGTNPTTYDPTNWFNCGSQQIPDQYVFATTGDRDTYFTNHLDELKPGLNIIAGGNPQLWAGESNPPSYNNANWVNISGGALTAAEIKTLYESNPDTNAFTDINKQVTDLLSYDSISDRIISQKSIEVPPGTVYIGREVGISSAVKAVNLIDNLNNRRALFTLQFYTDAGSQDVNEVFLAPLELVWRQQGDDEVSNTGQYSITPDVNELVRYTGIYFQDINTSKAISYTVRALSFSGPIIYQFEGDVTTDSNGLGEIEFNNPLLLDNTLPLYISVIAQGMIGTLVGGNFECKLYVKRHSVTFKPIATQEYVNQRVGSLTSVNNFAINIPARIATGTSLGQVTVSYNIVNYANVTSIYLQRNGSNYIQLTIPSTDGYNEQSVSFASLDTSTPVTYTFRIQLNGSINSNTQTLEVSNAISDEKIYYGIGNINPITVDPTSLSSEDVFGAGQFDVTLGPSQLNQNIVFLCPQDRNIIEILNKDVFDLNVIGAYTQTLAVRTIGTKLYNSYELANLNADLTFHYTIKHI